MVNKDKRLYPLFFSNVVIIILLIATIVAWNCGWVEKRDDRINAKSNEINANSGKPYYINMSLGICEFKCMPDVDIKKMLDIADEQLYIEKGNKLKKVLKDENNPMQ